MHIVIFSDQHLQSTGGAQVSMQLQRHFLERAGHTVTVVAPKMHGSRGKLLSYSDSAYLNLPSIPLTLDCEYSISFPGKRTDQFLDFELAKRPQIDIVHIQADFWSAFIGHRYARKHMLPVVHTMHNRVDVGIKAVIPYPMFILKALNWWQRKALPPLTNTATHHSNDGWAYLHGLAAGASAVTAPSTHFAARLEHHGVFPHVDVIWNGIDDQVLDAALATPMERLPGRPRFIWIGRISPEKRLLPFIEAIVESKIDAEIEIIGGGSQLNTARQIIQKSQIPASVTFSGRLPYIETLKRIRAADVLVQTSLGFETQGMTVFEAASLGIPAIITDPDIAQELKSGFWQVPDASLPSLVHTLKQANMEIEQGSQPKANPQIAEHFRQSRCTDAMIEVYRRIS